MSRLWAVCCRLCLLAAGGLFAYATVITSLFYQPVGWLLLVAATWRCYRGRPRAGTSFGTTRLLSRSELQRNGFLSASGPILGRAGFTQGPTRLQALRALLSPGTRSDDACRMMFNAYLGRWPSENRLIRLKQFVHLATFAPTGRGKGVSMIIPTMLAYLESIVAIDPKGELAGLTAEHRKRKGHKIAKLDPFGLAGSGAASLNPLDFINASLPSFLDDCRDLANALVVRKGTEHEPHWNDCAELVLTAFIAYVCALEENPACRNLTTVRQLISSRHLYSEHLVKMQQVQGFDGVVARLGHQLNWFQDEELSSVLSTVGRHTAFLDSPAIAACTKTSTFDPRQLRGKMTVYLILPPEKLVTLAPLMRMWISTLLSQLIRGQPSEESPVLFMLDEAGHIGHIQMLENAVTLMRGYGIRLWFFFQSIGQLKQTFGDHTATILDNIDTQVFFGINAYDSADAISKRAGDMTILCRSINETVQRSRPVGPMKEPQPGSISTTSSVTTNEMGRAMFRPDEVMRLPDDLAIVFHRNLFPIPCQLLKYYDAPEFKRGRAGVQRGLGIGSGLVAAAVLLLGLLAATVADHLPPPPRFQLSASVPGMPSYGPLPYGSDTSPSASRRRSRTQRPAGRSYPPQYPGWSGGFDGFFNGFE